MGQKRGRENGLQALRDHVVEKALAARRKYGVDLDAETVSQLLTDREVVRYPTEIRFDASVLQVGEFGHAEQRGERPSDGFILHLHPCFEHRADVLPALIAYHLVCVNYGEIATGEEAELFGATLLGMDVDAYYEKLCGLADSIPNARDMELRGQSG